MKEIDVTQRSACDSPTKTCTTEDCDRPLRARGLCSMHYKRQRKSDSGRSHHKMYRRTCVTCGAEWDTSRPEARFCTAKCKGVHLSELNRRTCPLPDDHPVKIHIEAARLAERDRARGARLQVGQEVRLALLQARECPGCAAWFCPLEQPGMTCCSAACKRRVARRRRRAREHGALGSWTWSQFMRIAGGFDYCCAYCGVKPERLDPDHVVPLSRGGADSVTNLLPTCLLCNSSKCAMTLTEWSRWLAERGLPARVTTWQLGDSRYVHLTDAVLDISPAA